VHHLAFPYPVHRFRRRLSLPQSDKRSLHQALVYAILAFACHFASEPVASQQGYFIAKARLGLGDASGRSAKPRDYILAGSILARAVSWGGDASTASRLSRDAIHTSVRLGIDNATSRVEFATRSRGADSQSDAQLWKTVCTVDLEVAFENGSSPNIPEQALAILYTQGSTDISARYAKDTTIYYEFMTLLFETAAGRELPATAVPFGCMRFFSSTVPYGYGRPYWMGP
jgi:hypothetical protein